MQQRAKGIEKTPEMSKYLETEMRAGVHISIKGEMSQPGRVAVAEEPVIGMGEVSYRKGARC